MLTIDRNLPLTFNKTSLEINEQINSYTYLKYELGKEEALVHFLNLRKFERLHHCCEDIEFKNNTSQVLFRVLMPIIHNNNAYVNCESLIDTVESSHYTKCYAQSREEMLRDALDLQYPSNTFLKKILAVLRVEYTNNSVERQLLMLLITLWYTLNIFSYPCCQKGYSNLMDHYRTFCIPTGFSQYELMSDPIISRISNLSTLINAKLDKPAKSASSFDTASA